MKDVVKILALLHEEMNNISESLRNDIFKALEIEKLWYSIPEAREEDPAPLREEIIKALGGENSSSLEEAIRSSFKSGKKKVVKMGGSRAAVIFVGNPLFGDLGLPLEVMKEVSPPDNVKFFDSSSYPLAVLQEVRDFDPSFVIIVTARYSEEKAGKLSKSEVKLISPKDKMEASIMLNPLLAGKTDPNSIMNALPVIMGDRKVWLVECFSKNVKEANLSEMGQKCREKLKEELLNLLKDLGF